MSLNCVLIYSGSSTESMTWMMPLVASMSLMALAWVRCFYRNI